MTLPLSFTRVKNLPSHLIKLHPYLSAMFVSMKFWFQKRDLCVRGKMAIGSPDQEHCNCDPWPKAQEPLSPRTHSIAWKRTDWPTWVTGWNVTNRTVLIDSSSAPWLTSSPVWKSWGSITKQRRRNADQAKAILFTNICCFFLEWKWQVILIWNGRALGLTSGIEPLTPVALFWV